MYIVTPHVGVWIETIIRVSYGKVTNVTPHVGVWIETHLSPVKRLKRVSHSPCGSVD